MRETNGSSQPAGPDWDGMPIVCTDRGQHPRSVVATVRIAGEDSDGIIYQYTHVNRRGAVLRGRGVQGPIGPMVAAYEDKHDLKSNRSRKSMTFDCDAHGCRQHVVIDTNRWLAILTEAQRVGLREVDISRLY